MMIQILKSMKLASIALALMLAAACSLTGHPREVEVPDELIGTWVFFNHRDGNEQMAIYPGGRVLTVYSDGSLEEAFYTEGFMGRMNQYGSDGVALRAAGDGVLVQYADSNGWAKTWRRIDSYPTLEPLHPPHQ